MKNQYQAVWHNTDGNCKELWPIYANCAEDAKQEAINFMIHRWGKTFVNFDSLLIKQS